MPTKKENPLSVTRIIVPLSIVAAILTVITSIVLIMANPSQLPTQVKGEKKEDPIVESTKKDLADQLGIGIDQIKTVAVEKKEWPDSSLGCPQPGYMYAQVITPGYWIILEANGEKFDYHTDLEGRVVLCRS